MVQMRRRRARSEVPYFTSKLLTNKINTGNGYSLWLVWIACPKLVQRRKSQSLMPKIYFIFTCFNTSKTEVNSDEDNQVVFYSSKVFSWLEILLEFIFYLDNTPSCYGIYMHFSVLFITIWILYVGINEELMIFTCCSHYIPSWSSTIDGSELFSD